MSVENKIKELLARANDKQQLTEESTESLVASGIADSGAMASMKMSKDTSKAGQAAIAGDVKQPRQGSSEDAPYTEHDEDESNPGKTSASSISHAGLPSSKGDAKSVKVSAMEEVGPGDEEEEEEDDDFIDISEQLNSIFGEDLSEEFKTRATSIFEAAVIARVNEEMSKVVEQLDEQSSADLQEFKEAIVEKVDSYLNYVVDQWMEENQIQIESGLRTEIAEDFISGLKTLFQEHYIDVPEEQFDVVNELQTKTEELEAQLDETISDAVILAKELASLKAEKVIEEQTKDLAATEVEKLKKLVEGVDFDSEDLYREKVSVIKENYFPKAQKLSPEKMLVEQSNATGAVFDTTETMSKYVQSISRSVKNR